MLKRFSILVVGLVFAVNLFVNLFITFPTTKLVVEGLTGISIGWDQTDEERFDGLQRRFNELHASQEATRGKADEISGQFSFIVRNIAEKAGEERKRNIAYQDEFFRDHFIPLRSEAHQSELSLKSIRYELNRLVKLLRKKEVITEPEWAEWSTAF